MRALFLLFVLAFSFAAPASADRTMFTSADSVEEVDARLSKLPEDGKRRLKAALWSDKATILYRHGRMPEAAAAFEESLTFKTSKALRKHVYLFMGKSYESHGRLDKAIAAYEEALKYDPKNWRRHRDLGGLYEQVKLYRKARDLYQSARELNPREPSLWYVSARVLRKTGLYIEAEPYLNKAEDLGHDEHAVRRERSLVKEGRGRYNEALEAWARGAGDSNDPGDIGRSIYLAVMAGNGDIARDNLKRLKMGAATKDTIRLYENLIELLPSGPGPLLSLRGKYPEIEALVRSFLAHERTP